MSPNIENQLRFLELSPFEGRQHSGIDVSFPLLVTMQSLNISLLGLAKYRPDHHRACTQRDSSGTEYTHLARAALAVDGQVWSNSRGVLLDAVLLVLSGGVVAVCITLAYHGSWGGRPMIVPRFVFRFYFSPCFMCLAFCCVCLVTYLMYVHALSCNPPSAFFRVTIWSNKKPGKRSVVFILERL